MFNWRNLLGPIPVLTLAAILISATTTSLPKIENGFQVAAQKILKDSGHDWANVEVSGLSLNVNGTAPTQELQDEALGALNTIQGVESVTNATTLAPAERPYSFSVKRDGKLFIIEGAVPSRAVKGLILEHIRSTFPAVQLQDKSHFASGAGDANSWFKGVHFAIAQLSRLETGFVKLTDGTLDIEGVTQTAETYDTLKTALKVLPESIRLNKNSIAIMRPENYEFSLGRIGTVINAKGFAPSEAVRKTVSDELMKRISGAAITDQLRVAEGAPQNFDMIAQVMVQAIALMNTGDLAYSKNQLVVRFTPAQYDEYEALMAALKPISDAGISLDVSQLVVPQKGLAPLSAIWDGKVLQLAGELPDEKVKEFIDRHVQLNPEVKFENSSVVRPGVSQQDYYAAIRHITQAVKWSKSLKATVDEAGLSVELQAVDSVAYTVAAQYFVKPAGIKMTSAQILPPVMTPYYWALQKDGAMVELTGYVPNKDLRAKFLEHIRSGSKTASIIDTMNFASTVIPEPDLTNAVQFAIDISKLMKKSNITFNDLTLSIAGQAASADDYSTLKGLLGKLPKGVSAKTIAIEPPASAQFFWKMEKQGNAVQLSGSVRHEVDQFELKNALLASGAAFSVKGQWGIEGGAPANFQELAKQAIKALAGLKSGVIEIRKDSVAVQAEMDSRLAEARLRKNLAALISAKDGVQMSWHVTVPQGVQLTAAECERDLQLVLKNASHAFSGLQTEIDPKFTPLMPKIADVLSRCPSVNFDVIAAAPQNGGAEFAQDLASRRARMIAVDLVREGIGHQRLRIMPKGVSAQMVESPSIQFVAHTTL